MSVRMRKIGEIFGDEGFFVLNLSYCTRITGKFNIVSGKGKSVTH